MAVSEASHRNARSTCHASSTAWGYVIAPTVDAKLFTPTRLRVCPRTSHGIAELSQHEADGCQAQESEPLAVEAFPILGEAAAAVEPADGAFHDPAFGQHLEAFGHIGSLHDLNLDPVQHPSQRGLKLRPLIAAIGVELEVARFLATAFRFR